MQIFDFTDIDVRTSVTDRGGRQKNYVKNLRNEIGKQQLPLQV